MNNKRCPKCGKSHYSVGMSFLPPAYLQPVYKDGVYISPDRNTIKTNLHCLECGNCWTTEGCLWYVM